MRSFNFRRFGIGFIAIFLLGAIAQLTMPWWTLVPVAAVVAAVIRLKPGASFALGYGAGALLWGTVTWWFSLINLNLLTSKFGQLLGGISAPQLLTITTMLGGLLGGMGALTGSYFRAMFARR